MSTIINLNKAAKQYCEEIASVDIQLGAINGSMKTIHSYQGLKAAFVAGAKWQREQSPWISVEDRMPEDEQLVLTSSSIYGIKLLVWNNYYKAWDDEDGDDIYCEQDKIDAWMPIPE